MKKYTTRQGDMWDLIAARVYPEAGGERQMTALIDANPKHREITVFPGGVVLDIPEVGVIIAPLLPPWKRG